MATALSAPTSMRKNGTLSIFVHRSTSNYVAGKNWHTPKKAFRLTAGLKSYEKRLEERKSMAAMKEREKELKEEKEAGRQVRRKTPSASEKFH